MKPTITVMWLGLRGFPAVQGGVEKHAENICQELQALGCSVTVIVRKRYQPVEMTHQWRGIHFRALWSPRSMYLETIVHTFIGVLYAGVSRPDILHLQAVGPSLMAPLARLLGLRVVMTHHGADYERQKWNGLARATLRLGEYLGVRWADERIVISAGLQTRMRTHYAVEADLISNGVRLPELVRSFDALLPDGLVPGRYVLMVSRFVPEKRQLDLIAAFRAAGLPGWKLVLVGEHTGGDAYTRAVLAAAAAGPNIVCSGFMTGLPLAEMYTHAGLFVLPSSHEGLPIAILEGLSYGLPVIASDIPANLEVRCGAITYFPVGDVPALAEQLRVSAGGHFQEWRREHARFLILRNHQWDTIAVKTYDVYEKLLQRRGPPRRSLFGRRQFREP